VSSGKAIALGLGVGVIAYAVLVSGLGLLGVNVGELDQFPAYVGCLSKVTEAETDESCRKLRSYSRNEDGDLWRVEELVAKSVAIADQLSATARNDANEIKDVWIMPILRRLETAVEVAKDIFAP
jgi:hypothetical protein